MTALRSVSRHVGLCIGALSLSPSVGLAETHASSDGPPALAASPGVASPATKSTFELAFEKYALDNGLTVLLHEDTTQDNVAVNLWYHVGPANEPPGRSGFAHLFEHLMFEGSKHVGRNFDALLESAGGTNMNGTTNWDRTNYFETVPGEHLELALWLESDRMGFMIDGVTQERLDIQRDVVKNERRESLENQPDGPSYLKLMDTLYPAGHPYHGAVIGSMEDLSRASLEDVHAFFNNFYAPANATLALAGNFDRALAKRWIEQYFGSLPSRKLAPTPNRPPTPELVATRLTVTERVELPRVTWAWRVPPAYSSVEPPLQLAAKILTGGKASRLERALVKTGLANEVSATLDANQLASAFVLQVRLASGVAPDAIEKVLEQELQRLATDGPTASELLRAQMTFKVGLASDLQLLDAPSGEGGRAGTLQRLEHYLKNPGALPEVVQSYEQTTRDALRDAVKQYLGAPQRIVLLTLPAGVTPGATP
jgi:zinc protease